MLTPELLTRLESQQNLWVTTVRPDGRPHMTPVWYIWHTSKFYICIDPKSVKAYNLKSNANVVVALEDGTHPLISEGQAGFPDTPYADDVRAAFQKKYDWEINSDPQFNLLVEISPSKWLNW